MPVYTLKQSSELLQTKQTSAVELAQEYLAAIDAQNPALNGYITLDKDLTLAEARAADERIAQGKGGLLTGVPVAYKDIFCQTGWRTACSSKMLDNFTAPYTATVVQNLLDAGMVTLGRTNMDEFAMGSTNETSFYGATKTRGTLNAYPAARRAVPQPSSPRASHPPRSVPTPAAPSASPPRIAASPASNPPTAPCPASAWSPTLPASTKPVRWRKPPKTVRFC